MDKRKINSLVNKYSDNLKDFKNTYNVQLTLSDIEKYKLLYRSELKVLSQISIEQYKILLVFIKNEIGLIVQRIDKPNFTRVRNVDEAYLKLLKIMFAFNPPIELSVDDNTSLRDSIFIDNPWVSKILTDNYELYVYKKWWEDCELKKHVKAEELYENKTDQTTNLGSADEWMDPVVKNLVELDLPQECDVIAILNKVYPDFEKEFDQNSIKKGFTISRKINKTSIAKALSFIYHQKSTFRWSSEAIIKHYQRNKYW